MSIHNTTTGKIIFGEMYNGIFDFGGEVHEGLFFFDLGIVTKALGFLRFGT